MKIVLLVFAAATAVMVASMAVVAAPTATVTANYASVLGTIQTEYGMNECDRASYFAGLVPSYPNTQILANHRDLGTKRIRIFYRNDWTQTQLDALIASIIACNAVPMVCFQYVPGGMTNSAWGDWCAAAVNRYKAMYDVSNWMWEIINEPNLTGYTSSSYVSLFTVVEPKIHAAYPAAMVGGPGSAGLLTDWNAALYASSSANNIQFISWHRYGGWYPGPNWPSDATILAQLPYYDSDFTTAYNGLPSNKKSTKLILGEFNVNSWAGDAGGVWTTDPRVKTIFNAVYYAGILKRLFYNSQGRQAACEMFWEGTGDDTPTGPPGFGMWYAQVPTSRAPVYYAKRAIAASFPFGASLVSVTRSGSSSVEAFACKYGTPAVNRLVVINETTSTSTVKVVLQNSTFTSGTWSIIDSANPTGYTLSASGTTQNITLNGYAVAVLGPPAPQAVLITAGPTVVEGSTTATVQWTTNLPSYSKVCYGPTTAYGSTANDAALVTQHSVTLTGLTPGTNYHYYVESGGPGLVTVQSMDGYFWAGRPAGSTIGAAKGLANGSTVYLYGKVISAIFADDGCIYIEEPNQTSGIRVAAAGEFNVGDVVDVYGPMATRMMTGYSSERQVSGAVNLVPTAPAPVSPVAMNTESVGGAPTPFSLGVIGGVGPSNIGLLVKIAGKVTLVVGNYVYVDDGSNVEDVTGRTGVMVESPIAPVVVPGNIVSVVGVVQGSIPDGWITNRRYVKLRDSSDLILIVSNIGSVSGYVTDSSWNAVSGATVSTASGGYSTTTDSGGAYTLSSVTAGKYTIVAEKAGYTTASSDVTLASDQNLALDLIIDPNTGTLQGLVRNSLSVGISGATVSSNPGGYTATTNSSGAYTMTLVPSGTYSVTASKAGYIPQALTGKVVSPGSTTYANFVLAAGP